MYATDKCIDQKKIILFFAKSKGPGTDWHLSEFYSQISIAETRLLEPLHYCFSKMLLEGIPLD